MPLLRRFMAQVRRSRACSTRCFILVGVGPLRSAKAADWMRTQRAGRPYPRSRSIARLARREGPGSSRARKLCIELIQEIREIKGVAGVHVMAYRQEEAVAEIIERSGVLARPRALAPGARRHDEFRTRTAS